MSEQQDTRDLSRRTLLKGTAATGAAAAFPGAAGGYSKLLDDLDVTVSAQDSEAARRFNILGIVSGWIGIGPAEIDAQTNPPLRLVEGRDYEVMWVNGDGNHHNFNILDEEGNVLESTGTLIEQGATETLEFTAEPEMASYKCLPHPVQMWGPVELVDARDVSELTVNVEGGGGNPLGAYVSIGEGDELYNLMSDMTGWSSILARGEAGEKIGQTRFDTLENGTYTVRAWTYNHEVATQEVTIDGSDQEITLSLPEVQPGEPAETFELTLMEGGWQGEAPDAIAGQTNPALPVTPGETYQVTWTNSIGRLELEHDATNSEPLPGHNFVATLDNNSTILRSKFLTEQGETQTVEFVAQENMGTYLDQTQLGAIGEFSVEGGDS